MTRAGTAVVLAALVTLSGQAPARSAGFPLTLRDATGAAVTIPAAPRRLVSLAPSVTETLLALNLDREVVGISDADDYPEARLQGKTRLGGVVLNFERIVALKPDLVAGMLSLQRDHLLRLRALGLPVLAVEARSFDETVAQIRFLGDATGRRPQADALAGSMTRRARAVRRTKPATAYVELWDEPVMAAAAGTLIDDLLRRAGGRNAFGDRQGYVQVPPETVLVRNPQVIFLLYPGRHRVLTRPGWSATDAGLHGRIYEVPPALVTRAGPRLIDGLELVANLLRGER